MWTRAELKYMAREALRGNYWKAFLVSLVIMIATEGLGGGSGRAGHDEISSSGGSFFGSIGSIEWAAVIAAILGFFATIFVISLALQIFVMNPLEVGGRRYFIRTAQYMDNSRCFRFAFNGHNYLGIVGGMALKDLYLFLWTLLLIIPGIVKSYAYRMVPYILADNPNIGAGRAIELSERMTYGHKFDIFILDLSFLGWYLLGLLCLLVGGLFVKPYEYATNAELYLTLRRNAIESGYCTPWELNLYDPVHDEYDL
ncbi:MAG TPA: DUF975 family protein [Clostridia bacterium]